MTDTVFLVAYVILISLAIFLMFWAIRDVFRRKESKFWLLLILFAPIFGSIFYFQVRNRKLSAAR
ncbi:MAG TPA: hypothetical protein DCM62_00490 [Bacteroidales bacterium]|nr:hypothetical protein [Bacteroidales bacterium]